MSLGHANRRLESPRTIRWILFTLLGIHSVLLAYGAYVHSPTLNEPAHLVAGLSHWKFGRFELYRVNPPLVRMLGALPVFAAGYEEDWVGFHEGPGARPVFGMGERFAQVNSTRILWLMTLARWACLPLSWIGALVCYAWTRDLVGLASQDCLASAEASTVGDRSPESGNAPVASVAARWAGVWAAGLWCFSPNILAHGQLMTPDAHATALGLAACYTFWKWLRKPTWTQAVITGVILGLAELAKSTLVLFYPVWPVLWLAYRWPQRRQLTRRDWCREGAMLLARMLIGIYVLNLGYGFEGTGTPLGQFQFVSELFGGDEMEHDSPGAGGNDRSNRFAHSVWGSVPVPLPKNYLLGIDIQQRDFEDYGHRSYLRGQFQEKGWWYYYLYVIGVKIPLGMWLLAGVAAVLTLQPWVTRARGLSFRDQFFLLAIPLVIFSVASVKDGFSQHGRYVLPCFPFLYVWVASVLCVAMSGASHPRKHILATVVFVATAWAWSSSIVVYPHTLSYFNALAGGPMGGPRHLLHSNIDWGQDLRKLRLWMDRHPDARPMHLAYYGSVDPVAAEIVDVFPVAPDEPVQEGGQTVYPPGWYAISVNFVYGDSYPIRDGAPADGNAVRPPAVDASFWKYRQPDATAGYSIYLFRIPRPIGEAGWTN